MAASTLFCNAIVGPDTLRVMFKAFDDAWAEVGAGYARDGLQCESARLMLANAILAVADEHSRDADAVKDAALRIMAEHYRRAG